MDAYFKTMGLAVGYNGRALIENINIVAGKGEILTLIGPNGAGKSTILKTITRQIARIRGTVLIDSRDISKRSDKDMARHLSVLLTDRVRPEMMNCAEVVAMGRYPYTNMVGKLTESDREIIRRSMDRVHVLELAQHDFSTLSDGQKQRVLLARALCQEPEVLILDEPTAYLDIRHKIEILDILRTLAKEKKITVIMSLHEIDLAVKISDYVICVKGNTIASCGTPETVLKNGFIEQLYDMENGSYNLHFGSVELGKPAGIPRVFVVGGGGCGISHYRRLQKEQIPFAAGILYENDIDFEVANVLSDNVVSAAPFEPMEQRHFDAASSLILQCESVVDAGTPKGSLNQFNQLLLELAREKGIPVKGTVV